MFFGQEENPYPDSLMGTSKNSFSMKSTAALRHSSSFKVANTASIHHFSFLLWLDLVRFHSRKPIFRGALNELPRSKLRGIKSKDKTQSGDILPDRPNDRSAPRHCGSCVHTHSFIHDRNQSRSKLRGIEP